MHSQRKNIHLLWSKGVCGRGPAGGGKEGGRKEKAPGEATPSQKGGRNTRKPENDGGGEEHLPLRASKLVDKTRKRLRSLTFKLNITMQI